MKFDCKVHYEGCLSYSVEAETEEQARSIADGLFSEESALPILESMVWDVCDVIKEEDLPKEDPNDYKISDVGVYYDEDDIRDLALAMARNVDYDQWDMAECWSINQKYGLTLNLSSTIRPNESTGINTSKFFLTVKSEETGEYELTSYYYQCKYKIFEYHALQKEIVPDMERALKSLVEAYKG